MGADVGTDRSDTTLGADPGDDGHSMKDPDELTVAVTGATGAFGRALVPLLGVTTTTDVDGLLQFVHECDVAEALRVGAAQRRASTIAAVVP